MDGGALGSVPSAFFGEERVDFREFLCVHFDFLQDAYVLISSRAKANPVFHCRCERSSPHMEHQRDLDAAGAADAIEMGFAKYFVRTSSLEGVGSPLG